MKLFISYSQHNLEVVTQLIHDLNAIGVGTWHDRTLTGGQKWWDKILASIRECDIFLLALSPESWESEACKNELDYAVQLGKPILPVLISDGINLNLLSRPLNEIQITDYRSGDKESVFALVKSIFDTTPAPALPDPLPSPPHVPISYLGNLKDRIESTESLSSQEQITLFFELEEALRGGRSPKEVSELLLMFKRRHDLLAKIATKIDAALKGLEDKDPNMTSEDDAPGSITQVRHFGDPNHSQPASKPRLCPQCSRELEAGSRFCSNCGAAMGEAGVTKVSRPLHGVPKDTESKSRQYKCLPRDNLRILVNVKSWLDSQNYDTQQLTTEDNGVLLQIKKRGVWRDYVGMARSLNIVFYQSSDTLTVKVGGGNWIDKAAVGTVSIFMLWPLAITAGYGAWAQMKVPEKIFDFIGSQLDYKEDTR